MQFEEAGEWRLRLDSLSRDGTDRPPARAVLAPPGAGSPHKAPHRNYALQLGSRRHVDNSTSTTLAHRKAGHIPESCQRATVSDN